MVYNVRYLLIIGALNTSSPRKELNMRHRRWLELIKDYDLTINYHHGKANVVVDALSWKFTGNLVALLTTQRRILQDLRKLRIEVRLHEPKAQLVLTPHFASINFTFLHFSA